MTDLQLATILVNLPYRTKDRPSWWFLYRDGAWERHPGWLTDPLPILSLFCCVNSERRKLSLYARWPGGDANFHGTRWYGFPPPGDSPCWLGRAIEQLFRQLSEGTL